jgi:hypothetical protein
MFRNKASQNNGSVGASTSFENDSWSDKQTVTSNMDKYSFFGFNLFETEETLIVEEQANSIKNSGCDEESVKTEAYNKGDVRNQGLANNVSTPNLKDATKRSFWKPQMKLRGLESAGGNIQGERSDAGHDIGLLRKIKENMSRTKRCLKPPEPEMTLSEKLRPILNGATLATDDSRDDVGKRYGMGHRESNGATSRDVVGSGPDKSSNDTKRYVPTTRPTRSTTTTSSKELLCNFHESGSSSQKAIIMPAKYAVNKTTSHRNEKSYSSASTSRPTRNYGRQNNNDYTREEPYQKYKKASNYDNNMWDDESTSSGWFSLESLDA